MLSKEVKGERIRIKEDVAKRVRELQEELGISFLEVVYRALEAFYLQHYMKKHQSEVHTHLGSPNQHSGVEAEPEETCKFELSDDLDI